MKTKGLISVTHSTQEAEPEEEVHRQPVEQIREVEVPATASSSEIQDLRSEMQELRTQVGGLLEQAQSTSTLLERKLAAFEKLATRNQACTRCDDLAHRVEQLNGKADRQALLLEEYRQSTDARLQALKAELTSMISMRPSSQLDATSESKRADQQTSSAASDHTQGPLPGSPAMSDAPPTNTLASFSSPAPSPRVSTPLAQRPIASPASALGLSRRSPRKELHAGTGVAIALPSHIAPLEASSASARRSSISQGSHTLPASPAQPSSASLGKHARESNASDVSVALAPVCAGTPTLRAITGSRGAVTPASKNAGHARKRARVSEAVVYQRVDDDDDNDEVYVDGGDETELDSFATVEEGAETTFDEASSVLGGEDGPEQEQEQDAVESTTRQDYIVKTKTGDEERVIRSTPFSASKRALTSTFDPSFFAAIPARSPSAGGGSRKSLPVTALPFPLTASPFKSGANTGRKSVHGTPAGPHSTVKATTRALGDASNSFRAGFPSSGLFGGDGVVPTPPAGKTLYGTERATREQGQSGPRFSEAGPGIRFEDAHQDLEGSPRKRHQAWARGSLFA